MKRKLKEKELKRLQTKALMLYGSVKYNIIYKTSKRISYLRKYLGISNKPKVMNVAFEIATRGLL